MKEKIGLLLRVSSKPQETDGKSLEVQENIGRKVVKSLGFEPIIFNEGVQSSYDVLINERPILVELIEEITKKRIKKVWVLNTDIIGRYSESWYSVLKVFLKYKVGFYIGESNKEYDLKNSVDKLTIGVLSLISQYDNELRRMRSVLGKRNSLKNGQTYVGSTIPFGYKVEKKMLVPHEEESKEVKKIFEMYSEGKSTMTIKYHLDVKTDFEPRRSKMGWNTGTIQKMLRNTLYKGYQNWEWKEKVGDEMIIVDTIQIKVPRLVDDKLWNYVQKLMDSQIVNRNNKKVLDSLFDGFIHCKSCDTRLLTRRRNTTTNRYYSCRTTEYKWKSPDRWGKKYENCTLKKKSPRVDETDTKILNHILTTLKESKSIREEFKSKKLSPKFDEEKNIKKNTDKKRKYINQRRKYIDTLETELIEVEFDIRTNQMSKSKGEKLVGKFNKMISQVYSEIGRLEEELEIYSNSSKWIDWLDSMFNELDKVSSYPLKKKKTFLKEYIKRIDVEYEPKIQSHNIDIEFKYPIIGDKMKFIGKKSDGRKDYIVSEGQTTMNLIVPTSKQRRRMDDSDREKLNRKILELKLGEELSLNEICKELNRLKILTPTNKEWDKPKLSSYYKTLKSDVGK